MDSETIGSVKWAKENCTPAQMDVLSEILSDTLISYLDLLSSDTMLDRLIEYGDAVVKIGNALKELNEYKLSACGKPLQSAFIDISN